MVHVIPSGEVKDYGCGLHDHCRSLAEVCVCAFVRVLARVSFGFAVGTILSVKVSGGWSPIGIW